MITITVLPLALMITGMCVLYAIFESVFGIVVGLMVLVVVILEVVVSITMSSIMQRVVVTAITVVTVSVLHNRGVTGGVSVWNVSCTSDTKKCGSGDGETRKYLHFVRFMVFITR